MNGLDLFSGIGGLSDALSPWIKPVAFCEIDPYNQSVLLSRMWRKELPRAPIWDDVRTLVPNFSRPIDAIFGGFPCQDISIAGPGAGIEGERSGLFFEVIRLTRDIRPKIVFLENVPAITVRGLKRVLMEFTALGYDCRWTIISAGQLGACHLRERWWLCAYPNGSRLQIPRDKSAAKGLNRGSARYPSQPLVQRDVWNQSTSIICRMDDGLRPKTHRIRALGNAVVPQSAREAFEILTGLRGLA